jgi:hypothetical protein
MLLRIILLALCLIGLGAAIASASPTPVPGGANQVNALSGKVGDTIFNGVLRVKVTELRDATAADNPDRLHPSADQKVMVMTVLLRNGTQRDFIDLIEYTLADADDVSLAIPTSEVSNANLHIQQGAAARQTAMFLVDKSYVPTKVLVQCVSCSPSEHFKSLRFTVP